MARIDEADDLGGIAPTSDEVANLAYDLANIDNSKKFRRISGPASEQRCSLCSGKIPEKRVKEFRSKDRMDPDSCEECQIKDDARNREKRKSFFKTRFIG